MISGRFHSQTAAQCHPPAGAVRATRTLSGRARLLPIAAIEAFLAVTVFLFWFGPWPFPVHDGTKLITFLALAHLALAAGYLWGTSGIPRGVSSRWDPVRLAKISIVANLLLLVPTATFRSGSFTFNVLEGWFNPGQGYAESFFVRTDSTPLIEYIRLFAGPLLSLAFPLTIFYWHSLSVSFRILSLVNAAGVVALFVGVGTNKGIADLLLQTAWLLAAASFAGRVRLNLTRILLCTAGALVLCSLFLTFFAATQHTRTGSSSRYGYIHKITLKADREWMGLANAPDMLQSGVLGLTSYLSQGYYALYLSLERPFVPMYGVGNSMFMCRQAARLLNDPALAEMPYPMRLEAEGVWDAYGLWASIYPWIASDVSFPGTLIVVLLIGWLFGKAWVDSVGGRNPLAVVALSQLVIMLMYFSANNQCLQSGEGASAFIVTITAWLCARGRQL